MALRIRNDGRVLCAAMWPEYPGDTYIDDNLHYELSVVKKILVTESADNHSKSGQWWWKGHVPKGIEIDDFYK